jgi:type II secretory pathway pseudopilin PulG
VLSRKMVARRISEGESGRLKEELKCEACGKGYKHISSLAKHLWEHTPEWNVTSKLLISKHQQVQLLEAASILVSMNEGDEDELEPMPQLQPLGSLAAQQQREREQQQQQQQQQQQHQIAQNQLQQLQAQQQQRGEPMMHLHSPGSYTLSPSPGPSGHVTGHGPGASHGSGHVPTPSHHVPHNPHGAVFAQSPAAAFSPAGFSTFTPTPGRRNSLQFGMSTVAEDDDDFGTSKSPRASAPLPPRFSSSLYGSSVKEEDRERMEEVPSPTKSASSPEKYGDEKDDDDGVFGEMD